MCTPCRAAHACASTPSPLPPRQHAQDVEYSVSHRGGHFFITLRDKERMNSELRIAPVEDPSNQMVGRGKAG